MSYKRSNHMQLYCDCPVERLTFPIERAKSPASECCPSPLPTTAVGPGAVATDVQDCLETESLSVARGMTPNIFKLHLSFHKTPWTTVSLSEKSVQYIGE